MLVPSQEARGRHLAMRDLMAQTLSLGGCAEPPPEDVREGEDEARGARRHREVLSAGEAEAAAEPPDHGAAWETTLLASGGARACLTVYPCGGCFCRRR